MDRDDLLKKRAATGHRTVTEASVHAFATRTGDYARMHLDHEFAQQVRGGPPIAHGLLAAAWALGCLTRTAPERLLVAVPESRLVAFDVRFTAAVAIGDTLALTWAPLAAGDKTAERADLNAPHLRTHFELVNQHASTVCSGEVGVRTGAAHVEEGNRPQSWPREDWHPPASLAVYYAEDLLEAGPRGETPGVTFSEADCVGFAREVGETNPRYLDSEFAARTPAQERVAPPMLVFCFGFAGFLDCLMTAPMPASGFAGHLGDSFWSHAPVRLGDTIRTRHKPLDCRPSRSHPGQAIVRFGLQSLNQREELVQEGTVAMMIPRRP